MSSPGSASSFRLSPSSCTASEAVRTSEVDQLKQRKWRILIDFNRFLIGFIDFILKEFSPKIVF